MASCMIEGCSNHHHCRGMCRKHYAQLRRGILDENGRQLRPLKRVGKRPDAPCKVDGCEDPVRTRGWCNKHYLQFRSGIIDAEGKQLRDPKRRKPRKGYRVYMRHYLKVRAPDGHPNADRDGYILEHRLAMEQHLGRYLGRKEVVHHINGVRDDNRIENLQLRSTRQEHGHGHERVADVEQAVTILEQLVNKGMTGSAAFKERLQRVTRRL